MKKRAAITGFLLLIWSSRLIAADYIFQPVRMPDAMHTQPMGINDLGDVVGVYGDCDLCQPQAFLFSDGQYYEIGVEGALRMTPFGINKDGVIAGTLINNGQFAFLMDEQQTTILDQAVRADAINKNKAVVGYQSTATLNQQAYKWKAGAYLPLVTPAEVPGMLGSAATGINDRGDIVGYWFTDVDGINVKIQGFFKEVVTGKLNPIPIIPLGINVDGVIVGLSGAGNDGAVLKDGVVTLIKYPGSAYTQVHGINNKGALVGYHITAGQLVGFIARPFAAVAAQAQEKAAALLANKKW